MITVDLCLSDIPNGYIKKSDKNNKLYLSLVVAERKEVDQFGNTHTVFISQSKEVRATGAPKQYVGSGKETKYKENSQSVANPYNSDHVNDPALQVAGNDPGAGVDVNGTNDDLPF